MAPAAGFHSCIVCTQRLQSHCLRWSQETSEILRHFLCDGFIPSAHGVGLLNLDRTDPFTPPFLAALCVQGNAGKLSALILVSINKMLLHLLEKNLV